MDARVIERSRHYLHGFFVGPIATDFIYIITALQHHAMPANSISSDRGSLNRR